MNRILSFSTGVALTLTLLPTAALSQQHTLKEKLVGAWIYVYRTGKRYDGRGVPRSTTHAAGTWTSETIFPRYSRALAGSSSNRALGSIGTRKVAWVTRSVEAAPRPLEIEYTI